MRFIWLILFSVTAFGQNVYDISSMPNNVFDSIRIGTSINYTSIWRDGTIRGYGNATVFNDLTFDATRLKSLGAVDKPDLDRTNIGLLFDANDTTEIAGIVVQMPHSWLIGSRIYPHIHWYQAGDSDSVRWAVVYKWYNIGQVEPSVWTKIRISHPNQTYSSGIQQLSTTPNNIGISGTGKTLSSIIIVKIYRETGDSYSGDARLIQFDIHYEVDGSGSRNEYIK